MNLLYTSTAYPPSTGGAQAHMHQLACQMIERHNLQVVSFWDTNRTDFLLGTTLSCPETALDYQISSVQVHRLGLGRAEKRALIPWVALYFPWMELALPQIARIVQNHLTPFSTHADLIHNVRIGREPLSYASLAEAQRLDIPFILTPVHHPRWSSWLHRCYHRIYCQADAVIVLTSAERDQLIRLGVSPDRLHVTGNGPVLAPSADPGNFRAQYRLGEAPFVLFLGQKYPYKGLKPLLDAAPRIWEKIPEARLVFIGPRSEYSKRLFAENQDPRIIEVGNVDLQEKTNALAACTLLCVPSSQESFGGVYTEAWSFERPVIGCNIPAVRQVISDGVNGFLVEQKPAEIADRCVALLADEPLCQSFGKHGRQEVERKYSWERLANLTENVYRSTLGISG